MEHSIKFAVIHARSRVCMQFRPWRMENSFRYQWRIQNFQFSQKSIFRYDGRKSRTCYGEVGVMEFGLYDAAAVGIASPVAAAAAGAFLHPGACFNLSDE